MGCGASSPQVLSDQSSEAKGFETGLGSAVSYFHFNQFQPNYVRLNYELALHLV